MYNYHNEITADIVDYIGENYTPDEITEKLADRDAWESELNEDLWTCDSVTGNASGSYYCNTYKAADALAHNWDILADALSEFGCDGVDAIKKGEEWCDVTIRCYLLGECLACALDEIEASYTATEHSA